MPSNDIRVEQADKRTDQANPRTEEANLRTERAESRELGMRASELSYRRLFESSQDGILILDAETGLIEDVNPYLVELLGYSHAVFLGKKVWELGFLKDLFTQQVKFAELLEKEYVRYENLPLETAQGRQIEVEFVSNVYRANDRKLIQCKIRDISERKRVEVGLNRLAAIVEYSNDAIVGKNLHGIITDWNSGAEKIFGYTAGEMVGTSIRRLIPEDRQAEEDYILAQIKGGHSVKHFETVRRTRDGRLLEVSITASPIKDASGRVIGVSKSARDITERKRVEAALHQSSLELQHKNAELERFLYTASHDLKSPVVTVRTFLGYLEQDMAAGDAGRIAKDMDFIRAAADKMAQLLDDLLKIPRIGRIVNAPVRVTFRQLVEDALAAVAGQIAKRGVTVTVGAGEVVLFGDRVRLAEVLQNLLDNACKFMGGQPAPRIQIGFETRAAETVFWVRDNGIGIDPRHQDKVFGLFEKLDPKVEGTGIGLSLVKRIVELHGGRIWVESPGVGQGAGFYFTLPGAANQTNPGEKV